MRRKKTHGNKRIAGRYVTVTLVCARLPHHGIIIDSFQRPTFPRLSFFTNTSPAHPPIPMPREPEPTWIETVVNRRPPYFWWFLGFVLAICFTVLSWSLCIAIFNNPENSRNYEILRTLDRLPVHKAYTSQTAPSHPPAMAPVLRKSFLKFSPEELKTVNRSLLHSYLTNFKEITFCSYLVGSYQITASRKLTQSDIIKEGIAIQFRAYLQPDEYNKIAPYPVVAEIIFPTKNTSIYKDFKPGKMLDLNITPYFASLLHVGVIEQKDDDTIIRLTAVSLAEKMKSPLKKTFKLTPPSELNLDAHYPLFPADLPKVKAPGPIQ